MSMPTGRRWASGWTDSTDLPLVGALQDRMLAHDGFVTVFSEDGTDVAFSTYFGGTGNDAVQRPGVRSLRCRRSRRDHGVLATSRSAVNAYHGGGDVFVARADDGISGAWRVDGERGAHLGARRRSTVSFTGSASGGTASTPTTGTSATARRTPPQLEPRPHVHRRRDLHRDAHGHRLGGLPRPPPRSRSPSDGDLHHRLHRDRPADGLGAGGHAAGGGAVRRARPRRPRTALSRPPSCGTSATAPPRRSRTRPTPIRPRASTTGR